MTVDVSEVELYAILSQDGKWFRRKGYGGYGETWTDDFRRARVYNRISPARGVISFFANTYPDFGTPRLVRFLVSGVTVLDETDRVKKQRDRKALSEAMRQKYLAKIRLQSAKANLARAQSEIEGLSK